MNNLELLKQSGITFDWAVPQPWLDRILRLSSTTIKHWVWVYPEGYVFGLPYPVTDKGKKILVDLAEPYYAPRMVRRYIKKEDCTMDSPFVIALRAVPRLEGGELIEVFVLTLGRMIDVDSGVPDEGTHDLISTILDQVDDYLVNLVDVYRSRVCTYQRLLETVRRIAVP